MPVPDPQVRAAKIKALAQSLTDLSESQLDWMEGVIRQFTIDPDLQRNPTSDLVTDCVLAMFGDALQIHHCFSTEALSKDRFEYALNRVLNQCGVPATLADKCNPGHDITIKGTPFSLKTQADRGIRKELLHISKFMELGKGQWVNETDLVGLRDRFFRHMTAYARILQLRRLIDTETLQQYELVEIPKDLLSKSAGCVPVMMNDSKQTPKPGKCSVTENGHLLFELYFDGGTERKLQIRHLRKDLCIVHGVWGIKRIPLSTEVT